MLTDYIKLTPSPGPQTEFLACPADVALYGGGAGCGGTTALLLDALCYANQTGWEGLLVRAERHQQAISKILELAGANVERRPRNRLVAWFGEAELTIATIADKDVDDFAGDSYNWVGVDGATRFSMHNLLSLISLASEGARPLTRMCAVADGGHWIAKLIEPYLLPDGTADRSKSGMIMQLVRSLATWDCQTGLMHSECRLVPNATGPLARQGLTFAYFPATMDDNPHLDDGFKRRLSMVDVTGRRATGNWRGR